ncbi:MAG: DJ-1/PfpI family protein [Arcobacter sp.]|nr:DJ-1/PfpI family protein [Arcobacter sp.]
MSKVLVCISNGFEEIETVTIIDILRRANIDVRIATISSILTVGANGIILKADLFLEDINSNEYDMIVLPGGASNSENLSTNSLLKEVLTDMKKKNKYVCAICASPYVLECANVLNEKYTCYPSFEKKIISSKYTNDQKVVIDEKVITSQGPATAMQFSLELVKILTNEETYLAIKNALLVKEF